MSESERFGEYVLVDRIAQGGMAELFVAKRTGVEGFEKVVAVKRILPELSLASDFVAMFINEAKIAARLTHPNIVQIFDFGKVGDHYFIAMEYVAGENLRTILTRAHERDLPFPHDLAAMVMARTCSALEHAHRKRDDRGSLLHIVHRDISPQNILVSYEGEVKVVDFGIAKAVAENPEATLGVLKGKLAYLSPEQVMGHNLDGRSDVFAAGAVFYELLTGRRLFDQKGSGEVLDAIVKIDPAIVARAVPNLAPRLRDALERALQPDRERRFASAGEMQQALEDHLRERSEVSGTLQLSSFMRLLFDERAGEETIQRLRSEVMRTLEARPPARRAIPLAVSPRVAAAVTGGALGVVALLIVTSGSETTVGPEPTPLPRVAAEPTVAPANPEPTTVPGHAEPAGPSEPMAPELSAQLASVNRAEEPEPTVKPPSAGAIDLERSLAALEAGRPGDALEHFRAAFSADASLREAHADAYARALTEEGKRLFGEEGGALPAADRFREAVALGRGLYEPHFYLAKILTGQGDPDGAIVEYEKAIQIDPDQPDARFNLGYIHFRSSRYEAALEQYRSVLDLRPEYLEDVFYNVSVCYERLGRRDDALAILRRGLDELPASQLLQQRLGQLGG